ncbi:MAG: transglutaminase-like domain-containing protein [Candidatus Omnitrophota bacterium]|nr:transglutaminase-like domain-containing protein [Candidatus Omnitrophota bacterium]
MKKRVIFLLACVMLLFLLNVQVTTRKGIDYKVEALRLPLYLKILNFYDRHLNYKWLVNNIVNAKSSDSEKVMAIFNWTIGNIKEQPGSLPVVDDHVWSIIVRGYGASDQFSNVFTTLCYYAGLKAFFARVYNFDNTQKVAFSFVKIGNNWHIFEPHRGVYFLNKENSLASIDDISRGNWIEKKLKDSDTSGGIRFSDYFSQVASIDYELSHRHSRAALQSPINRFLHILLSNITPVLTKQ